MARQQRRYPRVPFDGTGEMEVRFVGGRRDPLRVPVAFRTVSPEGVCVDVEDTAETFTRGQPVTVHVSGDGCDVELPGRIVWSTGKARYGVSLQLALAPGSARQTWARWVVERIRRSA